MENFRIVIKGASPLLLHSCIGVNPLHPLSIQSKKLTSKRKKTDEDLLEIARLDFMLAIYYDEATGIYIPAVNVEAAIKAGAKLNKNGKKVESAIYVAPDRIKIIYQGPTIPDELYKDPRFVDIRPAVVPATRAKVLRVRPRFDNWRLEFELSINTDIINSDEVINSLVLAGRQIGIGDYRPRYGKFEVLEVK